MISYIIKQSMGVAQVPESKNAKVLMGEVHEGVWELISWFIR
jgi:hypothetical protein